MSVFLTDAVVHYNGDLRRRADSLATAAIAVRKREDADTRLRELGDRATAALRWALTERPSLEKRRRVEALLKALEGPASGEALRELRAVAVLERAGTREARHLLESLARGAPDARLTREAKASLERLARRPAVTP